MTKHATQYLLDERIPPPELHTVALAIDPNEVHWAWNRPEEHRVPIPQVGDEVRYRHDQWGPVRKAIVLEVFDPQLPELDGVAPQLRRNIPQFDPHWHRVVVDGNHQAVTHPLTGLYVVEDHPDPWPLVRLDASPDLPVYDVHDTREARLRGEPGWLPLDWAQRYRPVPHELQVRHR